MTDKILKLCKDNDLTLVEDVCESHGVTHNNEKAGSIGWISNFSFFYAHHMSTIEGGMVCTNDDEIFEMLRMFRSHGLVRESTNEDLQTRYKKTYPSLNPDFIFAFPAYNVRNSEIGAVIGRNQLKRLDKNNQKHI